VARLSAGLVLILLVTVSVRAFKNDEYGLEATIPAGLPECVAQIHRYLADEATRARIADAGQRRAVTCNNYRTRTAEIVVHVQELAGNGVPA